MTDAERDAENRFYKIIIKRDEKGVCIPQYANYVANDLNAPALQILKDPSKALKTFEVKGANGDIFVLSAPWIVGFFDGEGTLTFSVNENKGLTCGFQVQPQLVAVQGEADYFLLTAIANFFGCGTVSVNRKDTTSVRYQYRVVNPTTLVELFIPFFKLVPLCTKKGKEFVIWADWVLFLQRKEHVVDWPSNMVKLLEGLIDLKLQGASNLQNIAFIATCEKCISKAKASRAPRSY